MQPLLDVKNLQTQFYTDSGVVKAVEENLDLMNIQEKVQKNKELKKLWKLLARHKEEKKA